MKLSPEIALQRVQDNPEQSRRVAILGFGREGRAVFKFLKKRNPDLKIAILDQKFDKNYLDNLERFKTVYRSPGVPYNLPQIQKAIRAGVRFSSATDLFFRHAKGKIIGVTGTKGKGTTATLIYKILRSARKDVYLAGNIGKPAISILPKLKLNSWTVLELSSFQLQDLKQSPPYTVILDIFPDHMDVHKSLKEYLHAKAQIGKYQRKTDKIFYVADNKYARWLASKSSAKKIPVSPYTPNSREWWNKIKNILKIPGSHNLKNAVMAAVVASEVGILEKIILKTIKDYRGLPYRLELIKVWKERKIYNDSPSTNPQTTAAAIRAFREPKILIMGGKDKNLDYKPVAQVLKNSNTKLVILFGQNKMKIKKAILRQRRIRLGRKKSKIKIKLAGQLSDVLKLALKSSSPGDVVLFSPGAASFDMFRDYKDRGKKFNEIVQRLT